MKRIIAMYLRVSTLDQARNGYGLGDQEVQFDVLSSLK